MTDTQATQWGRIKATFTLTPPWPPAASLARDGLLVYHSWGWFNFLGKLVYTFDGRYPLPLAWGGGRGAMEALRSQKRLVWIGDRGRACLAWRPGVPPLRGGRSNRPPRSGRSAGGLRPSGDRHISHQA